MPSNVQPETFTTWMREVERRLRLCESGNRLVVEQYVAITPPNTFQETNDATGEIMWQFRIGQVIGDAISVTLYVEDAPGEVAGIRLLVGTSACDELVLSAGYTGAIRFDWIVPGLDALIGSRGVQILVEARRVSGGGKVKVYAPFTILHGPSYEFGATTGGNGRTI